MKKQDIIGLLEMMGVNYQEHETDIYVESLLEGDEANWKIDFIDGIGYDYHTKKVVDYKLLAEIKFHNSLAH